MAKKEVIHKGWKRIAFLVAWDNETQFNTMRRNMEQSLFNLVETWAEPEDTKQFLTKDGYGETNSDDECCAGDLGTEDNVWDEDECGEDDDKFA